jgi:hypothetical protein
MQATVNKKFSTSANPLISNFSSSSLITPRITELSSFTMANPDLSSSRIPKRCIYPKKLGMKRYKNISLEFCVCADGTFVPPMLVWPSVRDDQIYKDQTKHLGIWIKYQKTGYVNKYIFQYYCCNILIPSILQKRIDSGRNNSRSLLILDNR